MLKKLRELVISLLLWLVKKLLPKQKDITDSIKASLKPDMIAMVTRPLPDRRVDNADPRAKAIGVLEVPIGWQENRVKAAVAQTRSDFELKVVDPFEDEITDAIVDALKDEQERAPGVRMREEEEE